MVNNYYAVIMAGGVGSRFWPVSTTEYPKQFHDMLGTGQTLCNILILAYRSLFHRKIFLFLQTNDTKIS